MTRPPIAPIALVLVLAAAITAVAPPALAQNALATEGNIRYVNSSPSPADGQFGRYMAAGDFDGNGIADIAVAGPAFGTVSVYRGVAWTVGVFGPVIKFSLQQVTGPNASAQSLEAGDFDNDGRDELAWGASGSSSGGQAGAGVLFIMDRAVNGTWSLQEEIRLGQFGYGGSPGLGHALGAAMAAGNFDGDAYTDLAIGVRGATVAGQVDAGRVLIVYGSVSGLVPAGHQFFDRNSIGIPGVAAEDDFFGFSMAAADFDDDGFDDLAVGTLSGHCNLDGTGFRGGGVTVLYGTGTGLIGINSQWLAPGQGGLPGQCSAQTGGWDNFGNALAAGSVSFDPYQDLVIGAPTSAGGGAVMVVYGSADGLNVADTTLMRATDLPEPVATGARFGNVVAIGGLRSGLFQAASLAIGAPQDVVDGRAGAGSVWVVHGTANRPNPATGTRWTASSGLAVGPAEVNDQFGSAIVLGDFNDDFTTDLAIGVYLDDEADTDAGAFQVIYQSGFIFRSGFQ
jgi:hypothetical protein